MSSITSGKTRPGAKALVVILAVVLCFSGLAIGMLGYCDNQNKKTLRDNDDEGRVPPVRYDVMVTKTANKGAACVGETITYTVNVTNTGNAALHDVLVLDSLVGEIGFENTLQSGSPGNFRVYTYNYTVKPTDSNPLVNTVNVSAKKNEGANTPYTIFNESSESVIIKEVCRGEICIEKVVLTEIRDRSSGGSDFAEYTFKFRINNTDGTPAFDETYNITTEAPVCLELPAGYYLITELPIDGFEIPEPFIATVVAGGNDTVRLYNLYINASLSVEKSANVELAAPGEVITYTICVNNTGNQPLFNVTIEDSLVGEIGFLPELGIGEKHCIVYNYTIGINNTGVISNCVNVSSVDIFGMYHNASACANVTITLPIWADIQINKTVEPSVAWIGDMVTYLICVNNTGDETLYNVTVIDPLLGEISVPSLEAGAGFCVYVPYTISENDTMNDVLTNCATVTAYYDDEVITDTACAELILAQMEFTNMICGIVEYGCTIFDIDNPRQIPYDLPVENIMVHLIQQGTLDSIELTTLTDANGEYYFENLPAGDFLVALELGEDCYALDYDSALVNLEGDNDIEYANFSNVRMYSPGAMDIYFWTYGEGLEMVEANWSSLIETGIFSIGFFEGMNFTNPSAPYFSSAGQLASFILGVLENSSALYNIAVESVGLFLNMFFGYIPYSNYVWLGYMSYLPYQPINSQDILNVRELFIYIVDNSMTIAGLSEDNQEQLLYLLQAMNDDQEIFVVPCTCINK